MEDRGGVTVDTDVGEEAWSCLCKVWKVYNAKHKSSLFLDTPHPPLPHAHLGRFTARQRGEQGEIMDTSTVIIITKSQC